MLPGAIFELFGNGVTMYGICIAVGILACIVVLFTYTKKQGVPSEVQDYIFYVGIGAIAAGFFSAQLFQAFYNWIANGFKNFSLFGAGLTVMGGIVGGVIMFIVLYYSVGPLVFKGKKKGLHKKYFIEVLRVAPICITIAHAFGRIGCLMSGCCHGAYLGTEPVAGGIYMNGVSNGWGYYVPIQLYEAIFLFALFAVLSVLYFKRCNITAIIYLASYAIWRMIIEFFRGDYRGGAEQAALSPSQWQSIVFILLAVALLITYIVMKIPFFLPKQGEEGMVEKTTEKN